MSVARNQLKLGKEFLSALRSFLNELCGDRCWGFADVQPSPNGDVKGVFIGRDRDLYQFAIEGNSFRYSQIRENTKLDSLSVSYLCNLSGIPLPLQGDDAYSSGFLNYMLRQDKASDRRKCGVGLPCGDSCISKSDECRITLRRPTTRKNLAKIKDIAKVVDKVGASPVLGPLLGIAGIAGLGLVAGLAIGGYMGANAARQPVPPPESPGKPKAERVRRSRYKPEQVTDPWDTPEGNPVATVPVEKPKRKRSQPPPPQESVVQQELDLNKKPAEVDEQQLPIDQGIRYVEQERTIVTVPEETTGVVMMDVNALRVAPKLFQYKLPNEIGASASRQFREQGTTGALADIDAWNPELAGAIQVWRVPQTFSSAGETYNEGEVLVVHGHHRLALAKRANRIVTNSATGETAEGKVEQVKAEFIPARTTREAKILGAMQNIAQGAGTARDAGAIFRELKLNDPEQLKGRGISMKGAIAEQGLGLAGLNNRLWSKVTDLGNTEMTVRRASYIGQIRDPDLQDEVWDNVRKRQGATDEYVKSLSKTVQHQLETGQVGVEEQGDQGSLFDVQKVVASVADRAEVDSYIETQISREANFWKRAARPAKLAEILERERAGEIDLERAGEVSNEVAAAKYVYQKGKFVNSDPNYQRINTLLNELGNGLRVMRGRKVSDREIVEFKESAWTQIRELLAQSI